MKKIFKLMVALFFVLGFANADTIRVGTNGVTPGFTMLNSDHVLEGYDIDIWKEIGRRTGNEIKFVQMEFSTLFPLLQDGRIDVVASSVSYTNERSKVYLLSNPYLYDEHVLVSRPEREIKDVKDISGWSVGVTQGSTSEEEIVEEFEKKNNIKVQVKYFENFSRDQVIAKKIDLTIFSAAMANDAIKRIGKDKLKILVYTGIHDTSVFPFAKSTRGQKLFELTNKTLQEMRDDGTLKELSLKWFEMDLTEKSK